MSSDEPSLLVSLEASSSSSSPSLSASAQSKFVTEEKDENRSKVREGEKAGKLNTICLSNFLPQIIFQPCYFSISLKALEVQYIFPGEN